MYTAELVADGLGDAGFDVCDPALENSRCLKVTNARHAYCEIILGEKGAVSWEYRSFDGQVCPAQITGMVLTILGAATLDGVATVVTLRPGLTLRASVGRVLREQGMRVGMPANPDEPCEKYTEVRATNPDLPDRGSVCVNDEGMIMWNCRISGLARGDELGITPGELARTIADALQVAERAS